MVEKSNNFMKAIFSLLTFVLLISGINVNAATPLTLANSDSITITRNVKDVSNPVVNTFGYTITPATTNPASVTGVPTSLTIAFDGSEAISASHVATKTASLSFDGAVFTEPGDYAFILTETASTDTSTYPISTDPYTLYVSVRYDTVARDGSMVATVLTQGRVNGEGEKVNVVFPAESVFTYFTVTNTTGGSMGDLDKYFTVNVTIPGNTGDKYVVSGGSNASNPEFCTANTVCPLLLKDGETIKVGEVDGIGQIKVDTKVSVSVDQETNYVTTIEGVEGNTSEYILGKIEGTVDNIIDVTNVYDLAALTGVIINVLPYVILVGLSLGGIVLIKKQQN